jgi:DNA-binding CsgD family transcriptional regulator
MLVERAVETEAIAAAIASAAAGAGRALVIAGAAGTGKTALLELAERGTGGWLVRRATPARDGPELGVVRTLFERPLHDAGLPLGDLFWVCHALTLRRPLALLVDDAHCADDASLAALTELARRAHDLPLLIVLAGHAAPAGLPVLEPAPLSPAGSAELARRVRTDATPEQCARWHAVAGGNPWLVIDLAGGGDGRRAEVRRRLCRLTAAERRTAQALAILDEGERVHLARVADVAPAALGRIHDRLAAEGLRHPLLVDAVRGEMTAGERDRLHRAAATALQWAGAPAAEHLLRCRPAGDRDIVAVLCEAAERLAPRDAVVYLERALAEGVDGRRVAPRLADATFHAGLPDAHERLREAPPAEALELAAAWAALGSDERELVLADRVEQAKRAIAALAARDSVPAQGAAARLTAELALRAGRLADAERAARRDPSPAGARLLALALAERGEIAQARAVAATRLAPASDRLAPAPARLAPASDRLAPAERGEVVARLALAAGDYDAALATARAGGDLVVVALALAHLGRRREAIGAADAAVAAARGPTDLAHARHARCVAEPEAARRSALAAAALERFDGPAVLARAALQIELGSALARLGRRLQARAPLRAALATAAAAGAVPLADRARRELVASGARPRRSAIAGPEALTPRQRQICELAAAGRTNRAIAHALFLSVKTVETHLARAYRTLGVPDRSAMAAMLCAS